MKNKRNLSKLQNVILRLAGQQRYVKYSDVLVEFYGFVPAGHGKQQFTNHRAVKKQLRAARSAICKSFNRLVGRGRVVRVHGQNCVYNAITMAATADLPTP